MSMLSDYQRMVEKPMIANYERRLEAMQAEIDALKHDLERSMHRENAYLNDVMRLRASLDRQGK